MPSKGLESKQLTQQRSPLMRQLLISSCHCNLKMLLHQRASTQRPGTGQITVPFHSPFPLNQPSTMARTSQLRRLLRLPIFGSGSKGYATASPAHAGRAGEKVASVSNAHRAADGVIEVSE